MITIILKLIKFHNKLLWYLEMLEVDLIEDCRYSLIRIAIKIQIQISNKTDSEVKVKIRGDSFKLAVEFRKPSYTIKMKTIQKNVNQLEMGVLQVARSEFLRIKILKILIKIVKD